MKEDTLLGVSYCMGYWGFTTFGTPGVELFIGIGGELVLTVEGFTEKAMSHWLWKMG